MITFKHNYYTKRFNKLFVEFEHHYKRFSKVADALANGMSYITTLIKDHSFPRIFLEWVYMIVREGCILQWM